MDPRLTDSQDQEYEQILQDGITAARAGYREQARKLLEKALELNKFDARPWVWLSATTDDLDKRREYLEYAVAADPSDATARRGLVLLSEKLDKSRLVPEGQTVEPHHHTQPEEARPVQSFLCPQCGGRMRYDPGKTSLVCESCNHSQKSDGDRIPGPGLTGIIRTSVGAGFGQLFLPGMCYPTTLGGPQSRRSPGRGLITDSFSPTSSSIPTRFLATVSF